MTQRGLEDVLSDGESNRELGRGHMKASRQVSNSGITDIPFILSEMTWSYVVPMERGRHTIYPRVMGQLRGNLERDRRSTHQIGQKIFEWAR